MSRPVLDLHPTLTLANAQGSQVGIASTYQEEAGICSMLPFKPGGEYVLYAIYSPTCKLHYVRHSFLATLLLYSRRPNITSSECTETLPASSEIEITHTKTARREMSTGR
jgi:hypothetical protein